MTLPPQPGRRNQRYRDLVDLLLLREWVSDYEAVKRACQAVFVRRGTHRWPLFFEVPEHWVEPFRQMASDLNLEVDDIYQAAIEIRQFISEIDEAADWVAPLPSMEGLSATTWYYAVGPGERLHRVPSRMGEGFFTNRWPEVADVPGVWQREPGGLALIGVVVYLRNRVPVFIEGVSTSACALNADVKGHRVEFGPAVWEALAEELLRRCGAPRRAVGMLRVYLSKVEATLPCVVARRMLSSTKQAHWWRIHWKHEWFLWDLQMSRPVSGKRPTADRSVTNGARGIGPGLAGAAPGEA